MPGKIEVLFNDDGGIEVNITGVHYVQQYGVAAMLQEMARQEHAMDRARQQASQIVPARSIPCQ